MFSLNPEPQTLNCFKIALTMPHPRNRRGMDFRFASRQAERCTPLGVTMELQVKGLGRKVQEFGIGVQGV